MKRLISAALALSLLGATAAQAFPAHGGFDYRDRSWRHHDDGGAIAAGIGLFALAAILASQQNRDHDDWQYRDRDYGYRDYDRRDDDYRRYDQGYGDRGYGYSTPYGGYRGW